jgi:hypothetical protein
MNTGHGTSRLSTYSTYDKYNEKLAGRPLPVVTCCGEKHTGEEPASYGRIHSVFTVKRTGVETSSFNPWIQRVPDSPCCADLNPLFSV